MEAHKTRSPCPQTAFPELSSALILLVRLRYAPPGRVAAKRRCLLSGPHWSAPHRDGSAAYVSDLAPNVGDTVAVFLRVPRASGVRQALLRVYVDGEQTLTETVVDREDEHEVWLRGNVPLHNPVVSYRWLLDGVPAGYQWLNGEGLQARDVTDAADFRLS